MENSDSYSEVMGQANLFRNANFSALQQKADMYIDKEKNEKDEIEGVTMPLEIPLIDKFGGRIGKRVMKKLGMETEEGDGLMKTLAKKGLNSLLEKAGLKDKASKPPTKPDDDDDDDKDEPSEDAKPSEELSDAIEDEDTSFDAVKNRFKKLSDEDKDDVRNNLENDSQFTSKETLENLPDDIREASQLKNTSLLNDEVKQKEAQAGEEAGDALGEEPELLSGVKSAVSDAKGAISDATDTGLSSITSGVKSALSDAKGAVSDAVDTGLKDTVTTGLKDTVTTGLKDAISGGGKSLAEKLAAKSAEVEAEGGGPEDIGGDIVSAGLAIGAMFASIFGKHIKHPNIQNQETTLTATQGYGLAEE